MRLTKSKLGDSHVEPLPQSPTKPTEPLPMSRTAAQALVLAQQVQRARGSGAGPQLKQSKWDQEMAKVALDPKQHFANLQHRIRTMRRVSEGEAIMKVQRCVPSVGPHGNTAFLPGFTVPLRPLHPTHPLPNLQLAHLNQAKKRSQPCDFENSSPKKVCTPHTPPTPSKSEL